MPNVVPYLGQSPHGSPPWTLVFLLAVVLAAALDAANGSARDYGKPGKLRVSDGGDVVVSPAQPNASFQAPRIVVKPDTEENGCTFFLDPNNICRLEHTAAGNGSADVAVAGVNVTSLQARLVAMENAMANVYTQAEVDQLLQDVRANLLPFASKSQVTLDSTANHIGEYSVSLQLDNRGLPTIVYYDHDPGNDLLLVKCTDPTCTQLVSGANPKLLDGHAAGNVGEYPSLQIRRDTNAPVVAYRDRASSNIKLLICRDELCNTSPTAPVSKTFAGAPPGIYASLQLSASHNPVVAYKSTDSGGSTNNNAILVMCDDPLCSTNAIRDTGIGGNYVSLALTSDDRPVLAFKGPGGNVYVLTCADARCTSHSNKAIASGNFHWIFLRLDAADRPVVAAEKTSEQDIYVIKCNDTACADSGGIDSTRLTTGGEADGVYISMAISSTGNPVIAHGSNTSPYHGFIIECDDPVCSSWHSTTIVDTVVSHMSMALDQANIPRIAYRSRQNGNLLYIGCVDPLCKN